MSHRVTLALPRVRISFPHLFIPRAAVPGGSEKYGAAFWLGPDDSDLLDMVRDAIKEIAKVSFKGKKPKKIAIVKGEDKYPEDEQYEGITIINAYNWSRPVVVDHARVALTANPDGQCDLIYPGCYVNANLTAYSYTAGGAGIAFGLEGVQWVAGGDRLDNRATASSMFEVEEGEVEEAELAAEEDEEGDDYDW